MMILTHIIGLIGLIVVIVGTQAKQKKNLVLSQAMTNLCFTVQYFLLGAMAGAVVATIDAIRMFTFYGHDRKKKKPSLWILLMFAVLSIGFGLLMFKNIFSLLPIVAALATTYGGWQKKAKVLRLAMMVSSGILIIHDVYFGAYVGMLAYVLVFGSTLVGLVRRDVLKKGQAVKYVEAEETML